MRLNLSWRLGKWLLALVLLALAGVANAAVSHHDLNMRWQEFFEQRPFPTTIPAQFPHQACFEKASRDHALPVTLLLAVARGESDFDPNIVSSANAVGVMQIRWPVTARHLGFTRRSQLNDPCLNIDAGARYLVELLGRFQNNLHVALLAYNRGPGNVRRALERSRTNHPGKVWYSEYINDHLAFVLRRALEAQSHTVASYADTGRIDVISFTLPYRAQGLVQSFSSRDPSLTFDWFRRDREYVVRLHYESAAEREVGLAKLKQWGVVPPSLR